MRSDEEIVQQTIALAGKFYEAFGFTHREGFRYWESSHPQEQLVWEMACVAQITLTNTDPNDALSELEDL
jgi:hypothetical protein